MDSREIRELLNACRPDRSDLTDEQLRAVDAMLERDATLREHWASAQAWDAQLQTAFADVPVPDGLAGRLLAAVSAASTQDPMTSVPISAASNSAAFNSAGADDSPITKSPATKSVSTLPPASRWNRRAVLSFVGCAAAVLLMAGPLAYWRWHDPLTTEIVVDLAQTWKSQVDPGGWSESEPPATDYPLDPTVAFYNVAWQRMALFGDSEAVVYRLTLAPDHSTALLFVVRTRQGRTLQSIPPTRPDSSTGGVCVGVWKSQDCLYVLVVPGSPRAYLRALRQAYA